MISKIRVIPSVHLHTHLQIYRLCDDFILSLSDFGELIIGRQLYSVDGEKLHEITRPSLEMAARLVYVNSCAFERSLQIIIVPCHFLSVFPVSDD